VPAAIGLKRLAIAVATVVVAAFVTLVALSFLIPAASVRDAVKSEIHAVTGLDPILGDDVSLSLFPSGSVRFRNVLLGDGRSGEPAVTADELTARLRYFPLLAGHIEIADVTLVRPTINVTFSDDGQSKLVGADFLARACAATEPRPNGIVLGNRHPGRHGRRA
jgi:AsmA protein